MEERWKELCELASVERDPEKLIQLVREINDLFAQKIRRPVPEKPESDVDPQVEVDPHPLEPESGS